MIYETGKAHQFETNITPPQTALARQLADGFAVPHSVAPGRVFGGGNIVFSRRVNSAPWKRPDLQGVDGFWTTVDNSFRSLFGLPPLPSDISGYLTQAASDVSDGQSALAGIQMQIQTLKDQAVAFENSADPNVRAKAQAVEAEANGLLNSYDSVSGSLSDLSNQIMAAQAAVQDMPTTNANTSGGVTVDMVGALSLSQAQVVSQNAAASKAQALTLVKQTSTLSSDVNSLSDLAQGKGITSFLSSIGSGVSSYGSTLNTTTKVVGYALAAGILIYLISPRARGVAEKGAALF